MGQALFVNCHSTKCDCEEADVQTKEKMFHEFPMRSLNKPGELARLEGIPRTRPGATLDPTLLISATLLGTCFQIEIML